MKILVSMAGEGKRFQDVGYKEHKAVLPLIYRKTGEICPMVICSVKDLPGIETDGKNILFIIREFHRQIGIEQKIKKWYNDSSFISIRNVTDGQACTCLLADRFIGKNEDLLIASCDNGIDYNILEFESLKNEADAIVFTFRHDPIVCNKPDAFGWEKVDDKNIINLVSVKKHISDVPENDHANVGTFWFKKGSIFIEAANKMINENDRINNEFYMDQVIKHVIDLGYCAKVFEVNHFLNYGSPEDYEIYQKKIDHFYKFVLSCSFFHSEKSFQE